MKITVECRRTKDAIELIEALTDKAQEVEIKVNFRSGTKPRGRRSEINELLNKKTPLDI